MGGIFGFRKAAASRDGRTEDQSQNSIDRLSASKNSRRRSFTKSSTAESGDSYPVDESMTAVESRQHGATAFNAVSFRDGEDSDDVSQHSMHDMPIEGKARVRYALVKADLKGEDRYDVRPLNLKLTKDPATGQPVMKSFSYFGLLDGHNGSQAAEFCVQNLLECILTYMSSDGKSWSEDVPLAMVHGFMKCHSDWKTYNRVSGTTATSVWVDGMNVYVAGVGDSRAIVDTGSKIHDLTIDHRVDDNRDERERILRSGGSISRVTVGNSQHGPLRVDGTLAVSRSIGDVDVSALVSEIPDVMTVQLPPSGGRLILATDGVWDALSSDHVARLARKYPDDLQKAGERIVKRALNARGFRDDTTVIVIDVLPEGSNPSFKSCLKLGAKHTVPKVLGRSRSVEIRNPENLQKALEESVRNTKYACVPHISYDNDKIFNTGKIKDEEKRQNRAKLVDGVYGDAHSKDISGLYQYKNKSLSESLVRQEVRRMLYESDRVPSGELSSALDNKSENYVINLSDRLSYNTRKPNLSRLAGYPQKILVHKLESFVQQ